MDIGDKFLEKFEEHYGAGKTKLLLGVAGSAVFAGSIGIIVGVPVKIISYGVSDVIIPLVNFLQKVDFSRLTHIQSKLISDIVVAVSASTASAIIIWAIASTMVWSLIQNVRLWLDKRDLQKRMSGIHGALKEVKTDFGEMRQAHNEFYVKLDTGLDDLQSEIRELRVDAEERENQHQAALQAIRDKDKEIAALNERLAEEKRR